MAARRRKGTPTQAASAHAVLRSLVTLSRELGREDRHLAILAEGNCSAACGDGTFWVKASGSQLRTIDAAGFCRLRMAAITGLIDPGLVSDAEVRSILQQALTVHHDPLPSIESFLHAVCLTDGAARWVAHTHPVSVNSILCSKAGAGPLLQPIFPDAIVVCGKVPCVVPYADPGIPLARRASEALQSYRQQQGQPPKMLLIVNHGLVALGQTAAEALSITLMADKWAHILLGTLALGGPQPLTEQDAERIDRRSDEAYRRKRLSGS